MKKTGHLQNRIAVLRAEKKWTQGEVAKQLGVSRQTINSLENNKYTPSVILAFEIARIFETTIDEVFQYTQEERGES